MKRTIEKKRNHPPTRNLKKPSEISGEEETETKVLIAACQR